MPDPNKSCPSEDDYLSGGRRLRDVTHQLTMSEVEMARAERVRLKEAGACEN